MIRAVRTVTFDLYSNDSDDDDDLTNTSSYINSKYNPATDNQPPNNQSHKNSELHPFNSNHNIPSNYKNG